MRAVVQRVKQGKILVADQVFSEISQGLVVYLGISSEDQDKDIQYIQEKIINLRIFNDEQGLMNKSVLDLDGQIMVISQFTLYGDARKGRRPSYGIAAKPEVAKVIYENFLNRLTQIYHGKIASGKFQSEMQVFSQVDGPVTILLDSKKVF